MTGEAAAGARADAPAATRTDEARATALFWSGRFAESAALWASVAERVAERDKALHNRALALHAGGAPGAARRVLETLVAGAGAEIWNLLAITRVATGDVAGGLAAWRESARRSADADTARRLAERRVLPPALDGVPTWDGSAPAGRTIAVNANEGAGDTLQLARYLAPLRERGARVVLICDASLAALFRAARLVDTVLDRDAPLPPCDAAVPLSALPFLLDGDAPDFDRPPAAFAVDDALIAARRPLLGDFPGLRAGLVWAGNPANPTDTGRSLRFADLAPLLALRGARFFGLQVGPAAAQSRGNALGGRFLSLEAEIGSFLDTAALLRSLDLVVTVCTSVAHLAGSLGVETWLLLGPQPATRWLTPPGRAPLYPCLRVFRRDAASAPAAWLAEVAAALGERAASVPHRASPGGAGTPGETVVQGRYGACRFDADDGDSGRSLALLAEHAEAEVRLLRHLLRHGQTVVDAGAGIGVHAVAAARTVGDGGHVVAIERDARRHALLLANAALGAPGNVQAVHATLGAGDADGPHASTLDDLPATACHLLRVGVPDALPVLLGGTRTIRAHRPLIYARNERADASPALLDRLLAEGYRVYWHAAPLFNPDNLAGLGSDPFGGRSRLDVLCIPRERAQQVARLREATRADDWPRRVPAGAG